MSRRQGILSRPLAMLALLTVTFAAGVLVERSGRWFAPYQYTPSGLESTFSPFWQTWNIVQKHYVNQEAVKPDRMTSAAIEGMLASLGDYGHTTYLSREELKRLDSGLQGNLEGIGIRVSFPKGRLTVMYTIAGSPARAAGLRPGDVLLEAEGKDVRGMSPDRLATMLRGEAGSSVHLRVARTGLAQPLDFNIVRAKIDVPDVAWSMLPGLPIAHLAIESFGVQSHTQLKAALEQIRKAGAKGLILDLRLNQGGIKDRAVALTSEFLTKGDVFIERDAQGNQNPHPVREGASAPDIPLCVLIESGTASSAEILAGALQDHGRGQLVGSRTFGTGTVLQRFELTDGSAVLVAVSEWLTPNGRQIWHQGISPDVAVPLPDTASPMVPEMESELTPALLQKCEDKQLLKAIELLKEQIEYRENHPGSEVTDALGKSGTS
jgi:carboxyl-terminal processing protease